MLSRRLLLMTGLCAVACASTPPPAIVPPATVLELGPEDVFEVRVFGEEDLSGTYRVDSDGSIDFPLIGRTKVGGLGPNDASAMLAERLKAFLKQPQVSILVKEIHSKKIYVLGKVRTPGTFPFNQGMNIIQAITLAGGFDALADKDKAFVTRIVGEREQRLDVSIGDISDGKSPNFLLRPGDIVQVPESIF